MLYGNRYKSRFRSFKAGASILDRYRSYVPLGSVTALIRSSIVYRDGIILCMVSILKKCTSTSCILKFDVCVYIDGL